MVFQKLRRWLRQLLRLADRLTLVGREVLFELQGRQVALEPFAELSGEDWRKLL